MKVKKNKLMKKLTSIWIAFAMFVTHGKTCLATGIGTAEVETATENIERVITSIAMPLRWSTYICQYSSGSNQDDCKCK